MLDIEHPVDGQAAEQRAGQLGARGAFVGGGTVLQLGWGGTTPDLTLIDVSRLAGSQGISLTGTCLRVGAAVRLEPLRRDPLVARHAPLLTAACEQIAALSVRHLATLGGNVGWGHGDTLAVLLAMQAEAELADGRCVPLDALLAAQPGALPLVAGLRMDVGHTSTIACYEKVGRRAAFSPTRLALALCADAAPDGALHALRVAASGAGLRARRMLQAEKLLASGGARAIDRSALRSACACDLDGDAVLARIASALIAGWLEMRE